MENTKIDEIKNEEQTTVEDTVKENEETVVEESVKETVEEVKAEETAEEPVVAEETVVTETSEEKNEEVVEEVEEKVETPTYNNRNNKYSKRNKKKAKKYIQEPSQQSKAVDSISRIKHKDTVEGLDISIERPTFANQNISRSWIEERIYRVRRADGSTIGKYTEVDQAIKIANENIGSKVVNNKGNLVHVSTAKTAKEAAKMTAKRAGSIKILSPMQGVYMKDVYCYETPTSSRAVNVLNGVYRILDTNPVRGRIKVGLISESFKGKIIEVAGWVNADKCYK